MEYMLKVKELNKDVSLKADILTFGCQQNEADSEKLSGMAEAMGYEIVDEPDDADLIVVNTCAIREHAEQKALSTVGQFKHLKNKKPSLVIAVCGCMVAQEHRQNDIKFRYPYVNFIFGTTALHKFPELLYKNMTQGKRLYYNEEATDNALATFLKQLFSELQTVSYYVLTQSRALAILQNLGYIERMIAEDRAYLGVGDIVTGILSDVVVKRLYHSRGQGVLVYRLDDLEEQLLEYSRALRAVCSLCRGKEANELQERVPLRLHILNVDHFVKRRKITYAMHERLVKFTDCDRLYLVLGQWVVRRGIECNSYKSEILSLQLIGSTCRNVKKVSRGQVSELYSTDYGGNVSRYHIEKSGVISDTFITAVYSLILRYRPDDGV